MRGRGAGGLPRLVLFVSGSERNSTAARARLEKLVAGPLGERAEVEVVDVFRDSERALAERVVVTPTLLVSCGAERARVVGSLEDEGRVLEALRAVGAPVA